MSSRYDKEYADWYEGIKHDYEEMKKAERDEFYASRITPRQLYTISEIEKRWGNPKFSGTTKEEASAYIDEYGKAVYNKSSEERKSRRNSYPERLSNSFYSRGGF